LSANRGPENENFGVLIDRARGSAKSKNGFENA